MASSILPIIPPPPGQHSNFINPPSTGSNITIANAVGLSLSIVAVILRMYTRLRLVRIIGVDDYLLLIAITIAIAASVDAQLETKYGLGKHAWDVPFSDFSPSLLKIWMAGAMLYSVSMLFVKLSFMFLYRRIFKDSCEALWRCWWWTILFVVVGYSISGMLSSLLACRPISMTWDATVQGVCINKPAFYLANATLNVMTDLAILTLPIPIIWRTSMILRQKIMLFILFGTGSFTCIVSIIRIKSIIDLQRFGNSDITYWLVPITMWTVIEMHCAILCACAATLKPFFQQHLSHIFSVVTSSTAESPISSSNIRVRYPMQILALISASIREGPESAIDIDTELGSMQKYVSRDTLGAISQEPTLESQEIIVESGEL